MLDIFISYARETEPKAALIDETLSRLGYSVWRDKQLPIHRRYSDVLEERLREAKTVIVLWSKEASQSDWVRAEADLARETDKLIQLSLDGTPLPMPFNQIQCGDFADWGGETTSPAWEKLIGSLGTLLTDTTPEPMARRGSTTPLLAVLPFDNLSGDADLLYFSDGVSEEILQTVNQTTGLKVIGRSSSFQFRGAAKVARRVAAELGCTHVLDGSVRRSGSRVRISAQLIECDGQTTLWSDRFDRELADVFALQDEIAAAVAAALKSTFAPSASTRPVDPIAYDLYLRARASTPGHKGAFDADLLRQATARAPTFSQAWAALAITCATEADAASDGDVGAIRSEALAAAQRALVLDPGSGSAYAALALLEPICGRFQACETLFEKALTVSPDDQVALERYSRWLHGVGRSRDAFARVSHAQDVDPLYHQGANWYGVISASQGRPEVAFEVWDRARARWPLFDILYVNPLNLAAGIGDWQRVDHYVELVLASGLDSLKLREAVAYAKSLRAGTAKRSRTGPIDRLRAGLRKTGAVSLNAFTAAYGAGFCDEAFEVVEQASFEHLFQPGGRLSASDYGLHILFNAGRDLLEDVRFVGLCAKLGLCDYWTTSDRWPDCAAEVKSYDFKAAARAAIV